LSGALENTAAEPEHGGCGLIRPVPAACATEDTGWGEKHLIGWKIQATLLSASMPLGECRIK
jgi:hypothetical protein